MPYAQTALLPGANRSMGENIQHFTAVRMRLTGQGNLDMTLQSTDDVNIQTLVPFAMAVVTNIQPTRLANFVEQRASLRLSTDLINEYFIINRIILYQREYGSSFPG